MRAGRSFSACSRVDVGGSDLVGKRAAALESCRGGQGAAHDLNDNMGQKQHLCSSRQSLRVLGASGTREGRRFPRRAIPATPSATPPRQDSAAAPPAPRIARPPSLRLSEARRASRRCVCVCVSSRCAILRLAARRHRASPRMRAKASPRGVRHVAATPPAPRLACSSSPLHGAAARHPATPRLASPRRASHAPRASVCACRAARPRECTIGSTVERCFWQCVQQPPV